jgi:hypothetical protein
MIADPLCLLWVIVGWLLLVVNKVGPYVARHVTNKEGIFQSTGRPQRMSEKREEFHYGGKGADFVNAGGNDRHLAEKPTFDLIQVAALLGNTIPYDMWSIS